ncbi:MAG TPA: hypothetical protein VHR66_28320 [Gemmataceae bacterium]|jgi:hypothetical protein|nr:hypothetical protein [Gemmataceae bacterium]
MILRQYSLVAGVLLAACVTASEVRAAAYNVYFKSPSAVQWTFYAGKSNKASADASVKELKDLGYQTDIVVDGAAIQKSKTTSHGSPTVVVDGGVYAPNLVGGYRHVFGPGSHLSTATVHHYHHAHHPAKTAHKGKSAHSLNKQHHRAKPSSVAHHHAAHHTHTHAHHHAHGKKH